MNIVIPLLLNAVNVISCTQTKNVFFNFHLQSRLYGDLVYTVPGPVALWDLRLSSQSACTFIKVTTHVVSWSHRCWDLRNSTTPFSVAVGHAQAVKKIKVS